MTEEQLRAEHLQVLGPDLGPLYYALYNEVAWLHIKWSQYRVLFAESAGRIDLLNGVARFFFRAIQDVLFDDVVLHIARLTDSPQSCGKDNLTLMRLAGAVTERKLSLELKNLAGQARDAADFARDWRNRHLAHRDLALAVNAPALPLSAANREKVGRALAGTAAVLNKIESHFWQSKIAFVHVITPPGDAEDLIHYLQIAIDGEDQRRNCVPVD